MLDIFKRVLTFFRRQRVRTDSFVFRLHHSATVALLLIFCLIVGLNQYVKSPIKCNSSEFPRDVLDVLCWSQSTFTVAEAFQKKTGSEVAYSGLAPLKDEDSTRSQLYYPWVFLSLFFQVSNRAGSEYIPMAGCFGYGDDISGVTSTRNLLIINLLIFPIFPFKRKTRGKVDYQHQPAHTRVWLIIF
jgi:hypothetical protein